MKLEFSLLIVDDAPDGIEQATETLDEYLKAKGFTLKSRIVDDLSEQGLQQLARSAGKDYDLVMVDYNLGQASINGAAAAERLRRGLQYTDMIFYSSLPEADLLSKLAEHSVPGVFVARRDNLDEALTGLADTVIGKAVDLNHMRGIAMAEVAEMDVLMEETLKRASQSANERIVAAGERTIGKLREGIEKDMKRLEKSYKEGGLPRVIGNGRLFSFANKYWAIRRIIKCLPEKPSEAMNVLESYQDEIIRKRNMLAHVKEESAEDGKTILRALRGNVVIDDNWMNGFRQNLRRHRDALTVVCKAIDDHFGTEAPHDSEEGQS